MLIKYVEFPGAAAYDSQMEMHTSTANTDIILSRGFQKNCSYPAQSQGLFDHGKDRKRSNK